MPEEYTLADALETCKYVVARHKGKPFKVILDVAVAAVLMRCRKAHLPKGWRYHIENCIEDELNGTQT